MPVSPVEVAQHLASQGSVAAAAALLHDAGEAGDAVAAMQLAVWYLTGQGVARDLAAGRASLRRAVEIGHVDAALMEIALTANGSGGTADWNGALALLRDAARGDPIAAGQLACVKAMNLDQAGAPAVLPPREVLSEACGVTRYRGFLTPMECQQIAGSAHDLLAPATVFDPASGTRNVHPVRTSDGAAIGPARENLVVRAINRRIAAITDTDIGQGEPLALLRYRPGQEYREHLDTIAGADNQRIRTVLLYLNDGFLGGETVFPELGLTVTPAPGDALVFDTIVSDGRPDPRARHAGLPVRQGEKWLATRWIRARAIDPWTMGEMP